MQGYDGDTLDTYLDGTQQPDWDFVATFLDVIAGDDRWYREALEQQIRPVWKSSNTPLGSSTKTPALNRDAPIAIPKPKHPFSVVKQAGTLHYITYAAFSARRRQHKGLKAFHRDSGDKRRAVLRRPVISSPNTATAVR
jgi:hypothetical protein